MLLMLFSVLLALIGFAVPLDGGRELAVKLPRYVPAPHLSAAS
jgi:hypothetical protein